MTFNCKHCGAPLMTGNEEHCPYCGCLIEHEQKQTKNQNQEIKRRENISKMKYVSEAAIITISIFTAGIYGIYWYITRRKSFNNLVEGMKFPDVGFIIYLGGWVMVFILANLPEAESYDSLGSIAYLVSLCGAVYTAFSVKKILREYAARYLEAGTAVSLVAPSDIALFLFGYIYLQIQINKMIKADILSPEL